MAKSTSSQNHANLIREMSRETSRSSRSSQHSQTSIDVPPTRSDFDPENEAMMSTRRLDDHVRRLPELRASAQKFSRLSKAAPSADQDLDYAINTSAIGRAFPDFSQNITSEDSSVSIEIGRGNVKGRSGKEGMDLRGAEFSANGQLELGNDSLDFSVPMIGDYEVTGTPPMRHTVIAKEGGDNRHGHLRSDTQGRRASGPRSEVSGPAIPATKSRDYGSSESAKSSKDHNRGLAAMHARVRDETEQSYIDEERVPTIDVMARNTRFGNTKAQTTRQAHGNVPNRYNSAHGLTAGSGQNKEQPPRNHSASNLGTQQSFVLPDMPNISELISGVYEDGTPVFSRHSKHRAPRFARAQAKGRASFAAIDEIAVPDDEQAIFLSLKLLQDKVAVLEKDNAEAQIVIQDLRQKNDQLTIDQHSRRRISHRSDSALGITDSEGPEDGVSSRKAIIEKNRLDASVRALQKRLDAAVRRSTTAETILQNITQERDSAVSQLSIAYVTIEQLKAENEDLKSRAHWDEGRRNQASTEQNIEPGHKLSRRKSKTETVVQPAPLRPEDVTYRSMGTVFDLSDATGTQQGAVEHANLEHTKDASNQGEQSVNLHRKSSKASAKSRNSRAPVTDDEPSKNLTYLSFLDSNEVAKLRRTLEQERIERKQRQTQNENQAQEPTVSSALYGQVHNTIEASLPRKSSMKDVTSQSVPQTENHQDMPAGGDAEPHRRHSETSILNARSRRRIKAEDLTSAFIVPDITIRRSMKETEEVPRLSEENKAMLNDLAQHESRNCTVCKLKGCHNGDCKQRGASRQAFTIPKPIPVSERQSTPALYEEEPTLRPSQSPALALATVIKGLEDEIVHLKIELAKYQALYNGHDPAISKRKRKSVLQKIELLTQSIDVKSDQIYSLYDVLEGQKQDGHELTQQEIEVTLQSIGVEAAGVQLRGGAGDERNSEQQGRGFEDRAPWDLDSEDGSGDDLPWEGLESTVETMTNGFQQAKRSKVIVS